MSNFIINEDNLQFSAELSNDLMKLLADITGIEDFYGKECRINPSELFPYLDELRIKAENGEYCLFDLIMYLNEKFENNIQIAKNMNENKKVSFNTLTNYFTIGSKIITKQEFNCLGGGIVMDCKIEKSMDGQLYCRIQYSQISTNGKNAILVSKEAYISFFKGAIDQSSLDTRKPNDDEIEMLTHRGMKFKNFIKGIFYKKYKGNMWKNTYFGPMLFLAEGRCMIDPQGYKKMNPNSSSNKIAKMNSLLDEQLFTCSPFIAGFSLSSKAWGYLFVDNITEIDFDTKAFDFLVMDNKIKNMVRSMIINSNDTFNDIISGKSGGVAFLLQGAPGSGKTLLSEASAEVLKKPLYSLAVGELGTEVQYLEQQLSKVLELCQSWSAILLIDEADIFMAKRTEHNINHNAIVSVFLRLLERYQGIMFLTTNRITDIDEAFKSRISITLPFEKPNEITRFSIWKNLLIASNTELEEEDITKVSKYQINGRQIKNAIRMAQCLAKDENTKVQISHLETVLHYI